jgi:hypothetical protein
MRAPS